MEWCRGKDEEVPEEITEEAFAERIEISEVSISPDGEITTAGIAG